MTMQSHRLRIALLPGRFAVCRLPAEAPLPEWAGGAELLSITRTRDELSIVCDEDRVLADATCERDYAAMRVAGTLDPSLVGILVSIAGPLAGARIPVLAIGTYDTDYLLVRRNDLARAVDALRSAGHDVTGD